jgi:arylsulfatase A-like enzyme
MERRHERWLASILVSTALFAGGCEERRRPNVILISLDTVRADHLSVYGYPRSTTPNLERLAEEGVVFEHAFTQTPWTVPSHMSVFTSLYPSVHSITHLTPQSDMSAMIPEILRDAGYLTAGFVAPVLSEDYGFAKGFDYYLRTDQVRPADIMVDRALEWLAGDPAEPVIREQPFFLLLHLFDAHHPYEPPWPFDTAFIPAYRSDIRELSQTHPYAQEKNLTDEELAEVVALYDGEIAYADFAIGRFFDALRELGLYDEALIVVFGDHGEGFLEHGLMNHGNSVYEELIRVPLLLRLPGGRSGGERIDEPVQLIDIAPTILQELELEPPPVMQGTSLFNPVLRDGSPRFAYVSEAYAACIRTDSWKVIENPESRAKTIPRSLGVDYELYHLTEDPREQKNLALEQTERLGSMTEVLRRLARENQDLRRQIREDLDVQELELSEEQERELRALGYVQ